MTTETYTVTGITCDHCVRAITQEVRAVAGVIDVRVDPPTGRVTVTSYDAIDAETVRAAVEEAGYSLVDDAGSTHTAPRRSLLG